jgi:hypothetical protein
LNHREECLVVARERELAALLAECQKAQQRAIAADNRQEQSSRGVGQPLAFLLRQPPEQRV